MYVDKKILCVIPARGGSKGLPHKNIKPLAGKPMIAYSIESARASQYIDRVIVSTESQEIADIARQYLAEVPFMRPAHLATDQCGTIDVLLHAIEWLQQNENDYFDILVLLQVTSPLRTATDIDHCIQLLVDQDAENVFTVTTSSANPYFSMVEVDEHGHVSIAKKGNYTTRQSAPKVFDINGAVYVWWKKILQEQRTLFSPKTAIYPMPKERSVDIDDAIDFKIAEMLLKESVINPNTIV